MKMSQQTPITNYFRSYKSKTDATMKGIPKKRKLSLNRVPKNNSVVLEDDTIVIEDSPPEPANDSQEGLNNLSSSDSSNQTIIYSPQTPRKNANAPSTSATKSPKSPGSSHTPRSSGKKFFSPNKKRSVTKKSPNKAKRNITTTFFTAKRLFDFHEEQQYIKACEGQDDKTKFLLKIVNDFLKNPSLKQLLDGNALGIISNIFMLPKMGMKLVCRLYWRKHGWYKRHQLIDICVEGKQGASDDPQTFAMLESLTGYHFLLNGTHENISFKEFTSILNADELKEICKDFKIKTQSKKGAIELLKEFCEKKSISSFFTNNNTPNNSKRVLQIMSQKAGMCYRLSDAARGALDRLYLLTYLGIDYDVIRSKSLELMLINEKIQRETFPVDKQMKLDDASVVFQNRDDFEAYFYAHNIYEDFLSQTDCEERCLIIRQVFNLYNSIDVEDIIRYKALPLWLQRFTPPSVYVKIMDAGTVDLKKGRHPSNCLFAVDVLSLLIAQTFREHKRALWFAEKALVLHSYLNRPDEAAKILLDGFKADLTEEAKDAMRPRAKKLAQQKNIDLDEEIRSELLTHASKEAILECNIPSRHFYKQPMENTTKGKAMYETKGESGRVMQGVEEFALSSYLLGGEYTGGGHWEGRIISTMFYLLFWDIIYTKPDGVTGTFLSHYQKYPLDMFCEEFYTNRREKIEDRLREIEGWSGAALAEILMIELDKRPECELSGINRDIPESDLHALAACLGGARAASLCRRLAKDYRYAHSGFPDLTMWNRREEKVIFVEVKSDSDKPSMKQIQWMQYLLRHGMATEFCYVGANTDKPKARQQPRALNGN